MTEFSTRSTLWAFLFGNFLIGTGVMLVPGLLAQVASDLHISIPTAGLLISVGAVVIGIAAPLLAGFTATIDRRLLLSGSLVFYAAGFALSALMPSFSSLLPVRALCLLSAAVYTPQAAATLALMLPAERRAGGITFIFLGWSFASVIGVPLGAWLGAHYGWRATLGGFALPCIGGAIWVWQVVPKGLKAIPLPLSAWLNAAKNPVLIVILLVTMFSASGQFTLWAYVSPYIHYQLHPSPSLFSGLLVWIGAFGLLGNMLASRAASRTGPALTVHLANASMCLGLLGLVWLGDSVLGFAACGVLWGLGIFAANSSQQARLAMTAPSFAGASIALNTSMIYVGQAVGASVGGAVLAGSGEQTAYARLPIIGAALLVIAIMLSLRASGLASRQAAAAKADATPA
jgi:MFS transporter, DHA1 family, inner membrane transport protein